MLPRERSILRIWNGCGDADQRGDVAHRADVDLAARQEGDGAVEIDGEAALDPAEDDAGDALVRLEALLERRPGLFAPRLLARELRLAVLVLHPLQEDLDGVARLDLGSPAGGGEFLERDAAFGFEADIDERDVVLDRDDDALDDGAFEPGGGAERFVEQRGKALLAGVGLGSGSDGHCLSHASLALPPRRREADGTRRAADRGGARRRRPRILANRKSAGLASLQGWRRASAR